MAETVVLNIKAVANMQDVVSNIQQIQNALGKLKMPDNLKTSFNKTFSELEKETTKYQELLAKGFKTKGDANTFTKSGNNILRLYDELVSKINSIDDSNLKNMFKDLGTQEIQRLKEELNELQESLKSKINGKEFASGFKTQLQGIRDQFKETNKEASELAAKLQKSTFNTFTKNLSEGRLDLAANNLKSIGEQIDALGDKAPTNLKQWVEDLSNAFQKLKSDSNIQETVNQLEQIKGKLSGAEAQFIQEMINGFKQFQGAVANSNKEVQTLVTSEQQAASATADFNREVDQVKSRVKYFLGLNNVINLVKRSIHSAVETVKELDKAITETPVVTNYTVKDMWKQLPEYTKRANELGVTTKDAYESATLYFQQGLNNDQAAALSVETLKMARIAGLEAAEATDRMTNALRGFNMELNTASAQRVDDVYSQLAAMSASNVDEISTAMTKVASLAHSANMEFETTAAFLAQIIETTRESAETAGTALKTVVARFSEVKKLVDTDQLKGTDEEGQSIDVNKVSAALRTAGIDLNKYFIGEVGLDDIFIELASKWDSLTSVQQRYIATQAAGSRQQSRFIALMQDYARTQELVGAAYNAEGASAKQFEKTQDSLQSKLARLKNAWDQFLMGLTNNSVIKLAVDVLTFLLNTINKLTEAFGTNVGSVLKWVAAFNAFKGLRKLFVDGGLASQLIGSFMGQGPLANKMRASMGLGTISEEGVYTGYTAQQLKENRRGGPTLIGGIGKLGKKAWSGAKTLGAFAKGGFGVGGPGLANSWASAQVAGELGGTAAGLTGVATALGAVAVAVGVVIAAYQSWLRLTPEGHLKQAKQLAETMSTVANNTQKNASEFKKATQNYKEYDDAVKSASTTAEYQQAVSDRTAYVSELMEQNPNIAQYVKASSEDGQFVLTINEQELEEAVKAASEKAAQAAASANFADALVAGKQADVYAAQLRRAGVNMADQTISDGSTIRKLTEEELSKYSAIQKQLEASRAQETAYAQQGFVRQLEGSGLTDNIVNLLSSALAKGFNEDKYLEEINKQRADNWRAGNASKNDLRAQYFKLYGQQADSSMSRKELAQAVATRQVDNEREEKTRAAADLVRSGSYDDILKAMAGEIDFSDTQLELDETNKKLKEFYEVTGISVEDLKAQIKQSQKARQENKKNRQQNIFDQAEKSGYKVDDQFRSTIENLDYDKLGTISDIITQAVDKVGGAAFQSLFDDLPEMSDESLQQIQTFIDDINFDNPIDAYSKLKESLSDANPYIQELSQNILNAHTDLFNYSSLIRSSLTDAWDSIGDEVGKLIEKNGEITADDIEDLAQSSSSLAKILELDIANAEELAKALTLVGQNKIQIDDLSESFVSALDGAQTFKTIIDDIHKTISEFDEGVDYGEGIDFLTDKTGELKELVDNFEFGNQRTAKLWELLFGGDYKEAWAQGEDYIRDRVSDMEKWLDNDGYAFFDSKKVRKKLQITESGDHELDWDLSQYESYDDLLDAVSKAGGGLSEEAAKMFLASFASHGDLEFNQQLEDLSIKDILGTLEDKFKLDNNALVFTDSEINALAASYGISAEKLRKELQKTFGNEFKELKEGEGISGEDLYAYFKKQLGGDKPFDANQFLKDLFPDDQVIDITQLKSHLSSMGYTDPSQQLDLIQSILKDAGLDEDGTFKLSELEVAIEHVRAEAEADGINVDELIKGIETACKGKNVNLSGLITLISNPNVDAVKLLQAVSDAVAKDENAILVLSNLTASLVNLGIEPEQAATLIGDLAGQLAAGGPINLQNTIEGLDLTEEQAQQVLQAIQEVLEKCGYTINPDSLIAEPSDAAAKKYASGLAGKIQKALADMGFNPDDFVQNRVSKDTLDLENYDNDIDVASFDLIGGVKNRHGESYGQGTVTVSVQADTEKAAKDTETALAAALYQAAKDSGTDVALEISTAVNNGKYDVVVNWTWADGQGPSVSISGASGGVIKGASSGIVKGIRGGNRGTSKAAGGHQLQAGEALTGEEGPEIVWNKEQGYAYVTGEHGPEFRYLNPGDRVFNADETARIFARSFAKGGIYQSLATGRWNPKNDKDYKEPSKGGGGSGSGADSEKESEWKNEIDWIYNLVEDIEELERKQTKLQEDYEDYLQDQTKTGKDLYNLLIQQLGNLYTQLNHQQAALELREREMREFMDTTNEFDDLLWYNWNDRTLEIDWDAIEALQDKDTYDKVNDLVSQAEAIEKKMDDADDSIIDIKNKIQELENIWRDTYVDFESRVFDAVVSYYQEIIDNYSELNDTLTDSNSQILNSLQKEISLQRQIRDNTKTEEEITNDEAQLAYLRRDTSGGNDLAALQLERDLAESRQSYEDSLVDQAISRLEEDNDAAAQQRQQQIDIMQAQLDYQSQNGEFNAYVSELLTSAMGAEGELLTNSDLVNLLKEQENWAAMSDVSKEVWEEELNTTFKEVAAFLLKQNAEENGTFYTALTAAVNTVSTAIGSYSQAITKMTSGSGGDGGGSGGSSGGGSGGSKKEDESQKSITIGMGAVQGSLAGLWGSNTNSNLITVKKKKYATGGLADYTGPAWLDGTPSEPEYVLNARQTDAFLKLADVLPSIMGSGAGAQTNTFGGTYITMPVTLESVSPDYDVDRMVGLLKDKLYDAGSYRNVNSLSFIR